MFPVRRLLFITALLVSTTALAQVSTFQLDPAKSSVTFTLGDILHTVNGTFKMKDSSIRIDSASGASSGALVVDATSGNSGNRSRDKKMHKEILESAKFPEIRFTVQAIRGTIPSNGTSIVQMVGIMSLHGSDHPMTVSVPVQVNNGIATADVRFEVPYVAWGMKDPSTFVLRVAKKVDIVVHAVGTLTH